MSYDMFETRKKKINVWFDEYIISTFGSVSKFGHLESRHLNKSDDFLMDRCKRLKKDTSSFIGKEEDILKVLIDIILRNREELIEYLADTEDDDVWELSEDITSKIRGIKYCSSMDHNWKDGAKECKDKIIIAFKKNPNNRNELIITSAYPT